MISSSTLEAMAAAGCTVEQIISVVKAHEVEEAERASRQIPWPKLRKMAFERDGNECQYCGDCSGPFEVDHVVPVSKGGENVLENVRISCLPCNRAKKDRGAEDWSILLTRRSSSAERQARYRNNKRNKTVTSNVTNVTETLPPSPPSFPLISPPTTPPIIPQSSTPSPAATAGLDFDDLEKRLVDAVGEENIQGYSVKALGPILGMIQAGADVDTDILPTIRSVAKNLKKPVRSWSYFVPAITDALNSRIKAGRGVVKPVETTFDESHERWEKRLSLARASEVWHSAVWGPKPGENGCKVPNSLLTETDGLGWRMAG